MSVGELYLSENINEQKLLLAKCIYVCARETYFGMAATYFSVTIKNTPIERKYLKQKSFL